MPAHVELWGGIECTVNRVGDSTFDQIVLSGHDRRPDDIDRFAELGLKVLRFPMLWERMAPDSLDEIDWSWTDAMLERAQAHGLQVIAGLVHHGSGPRYTNLLDPEFPTKLARFAAACAARYPWIKRYTPINEPLTTARFSGLYGFWYPHQRSNSAFLRMLLHQCQGIAAAMQAIRQVQPAAELVQTEDLGRIFSTHFLSYQAEFENERRWLSFDLLTGRVNEQHALWTFCLKNGLSPAELMASCEQPCRPDVIGVNHYITSNRFLDERLERYPPHCHGGNGRHRYADIEAVRVGAENLAGPREILLEAWNRYELPLAVTEVHVGCTREEQLRWLHEVWLAALKLSSEGVDIRAITGWSLLGSFDWDSLVTIKQEHYESGIFDLRGPAPRPTALARMLGELAKNGHSEHPTLDIAGWWHRHERLLYPSVPLNSSSGQRAASKQVERARPPREILITGGHGTLAKAFATICEHRGLAYRRLNRRELDVADPEAVRRLLQELRPWAVINAAGYCRVDQAEIDDAACFRDNTTAAQVLATQCAAQGISLVTFSSDLVFDGRRETPYDETMRTAPLSVYGRSKALAETEVLARHEGALIIRTSAFFGPWDEYNFLTLTLQQLAQKQRTPIVTGLTISPTYVPDLVNASLDLLIDGEKGIWHLANAGAMSWLELAQEGAARFQLDAELLEPMALADAGWAAPRPLYSALTSVRGQILPSLDRALDRYARECRVAISS